MNLSANEYDRLLEIGRRHDAGISTMIHLCIASFLGDPLPRWAEEVLRELLEVA